MIAPGSDVHRAIAILFAACWIAWPAPAQSGSRPDPIRAHLAACERFGFSGSVLVAKGGKVLLSDGFGLADREKGRRNAKDTLFEIASATKPFTAVAVLQIEADGKLSCDDPIARRLPGVPAGFEDVTIRHLLTHTSGMPRSAGSGRGDDLGAAVAAYLAPKRVRAPGLEYEYWNGGYALLAGVVEHATGATYMDWCRKRIFAPAGMTSSGFTGDAFDAARVATGYEPRAEPRRADEHPYGSYGWQYRGMGGLVTSVEDLWRFDRALRDDTLLPATARKKLFQPFRGGYACGFQVGEKPRRRVGHGGSVRGFHCQFSRFPDDDACIVVLCNGLVIPPFVIEDSLQALALGGTSQFPKPPETVAWPPEKADALRGVYESPAGERIVVRTAHGTITLGAQGPKITNELAIGANGSAPPPVEDELVDAAREMAVKLAGGDVRPIRERLAERIPATWPNELLTTIWPARTSGLGKFSAVRLVGSVSASPSKVLLAIDFTGGSVPLEISFAGGRLQRFDLQGPEFLVEAVAAPAPDGRLLRYHWQGPPAEPIAIVRDASSRPSALRFDKSGTTYRRLER